MQVFSSIDTFWYVTLWYKCWPIGSDTMLFCYHSVLMMIFPLTDPVIFVILISDVAMLISLLFIVDHLTLLRVDDAVDIHLTDCCTLENCLLIQYVWSLHSAIPISTDGRWLFLLLIPLLIFLLLIIPLLFSYTYHFLWCHLFIHYRYIWLLIFCYYHLPTFSFIAIVMFWKSIAFDATCPLLTPRYLVVDALRCTLQYIGLCGAAR